MSTGAIKIAVVGHTNVGKTSLLRTLTRDAGFGEVSSRPSTTRQVEGARLLVDGETVLELYDTPGLEEPIALLEWIEALVGERGERLDGPARIDRFLASPAAQQRFAQEAKVLRQLRQSDAALVVIDVRDAVRAKHRDELALLAQCAVPLLPVLNFVASREGLLPAWREVLARAGLHAAVRFDTVAPEDDAEPLLYQALATVLERARAPLQRLLESRQREAQAREHAAGQLIAELLIDVAAARLDVSSEDESALAAARSELTDWTRAREQQAVNDMLLLYRFERSAVDAAPLPLVDGRWAADLFEPELLKSAGVRLGGGAAAGAAAGVGIDLLTGGLTLGAAAALGALAGGGAQAARHYGGRVLARLRGRRELSVDDGVLRLLGLRALSLHAALQRRGHAAQQAVNAQVLIEHPLRTQRLPAPLRRARAKRDWSSLRQRHVQQEPRRTAVDELAEWLRNAAD